MCFPVHAASQPGDVDETIHVIQRKPVLQKQRFEINAQFGTRLNDPLYRHFRLAGHLNYHLTEAFYIGAFGDLMNFGATAGGPNHAFRETQEETNAVPDSALINWVGGMELGYTFAAGKYVLFNEAINYYDWSVSAGGVYLDSESILVPENRRTPGGTVALTGRIFFSDAIAMNLEVRDYIFKARLKNTTTDPLTNAIYGGIGLSLYLPTTFDYSD